MARYRTYPWLALVVMIVCTAGIMPGCSEKQRPAPAPQPVEDPLIEVNKRMVAEESERIDAYVKRRGWEMTRTGTGLRYLIYEQGTGETARKGQVARVDFEVSLLSGRVCYDTKASGPKEFLIGMDDVESGVHEGIQYMRVGDRAKMILPSHLAHGLVCDLDKITLRSTIIYDIQLIALQ
ncbi:MAG: FKBP-type peptidyl-prolyl cis-trans isomerase [Bacteroidota bacterium]